jgi:4'-phosphopantetheinyl transferase
MDIASGTTDYRLTPDARLWRRAPRSRSLGYMTGLAHPWRHRHEGLTLRANEVHVWRAALDRPTSQLHILWHILAEGERKWATRFYFRRDRDHYVVARALLRHLLGQYLKTEPSQLVFGYNSYGKPHVAPELDSGRLTFNVSHSHGRALFAFSRGRELGIDIERIRPEFATGQVAERFFSPSEVATLRSLPAEAQPVGFFNCWTRKEAYIKAKGLGLSLPLDQFAVSLAPGEAPVLLSALEDPHEPSRWRLRELSPYPDYAAAVAAEGDGWHLRQWCLD